MTSSWNIQAIINAALFRILNQNLSYKLFYFFLDAFCRVVFNNQSGDTRIIFETRSPTWNQMLIFYDLVIWGDMESICNNPPTIMAEIFDYDEGVSGSSGDKSNSKGQIASTGRVKHHKIGTSKNPTF